jgi:hypothetical protein
MPRAGNPHWSGWHWRGRALRPGPSDFFSLLKTTHTAARRTGPETRRELMYSTTSSASTKRSAVPQKSEAIFWTGNDLSHSSRPPFRRAFFRAYSTFLGGDRNRLHVACCLAWLRRALPPLQARRLSAGGPARSHSASRGGSDWAARLPLILEAVNHLKVRSCLIDGRWCAATTGAWPPSTCCAGGETSPRRSSMSSTCRS